MTSISENKSRQRLANGLVIFCSVFVFLFWGLELHRALDAHDQHAEDILAAHKDLELERKGEELRVLFGELYTNTRTISLLPMIRAVQGANRHSVTEDVVASGRLSRDAHHTMQQIYTNLKTHLQISEIYYVLDGFSAQRGDIPFFMYDDLIVGRAEAVATRKKMRMPRTKSKISNTTIFPSSWPGSTRPRRASSLPTGWITSRFACRP